MKKLIVILIAFFSVTATFAQQHRDGRNQKQDSYRDQSFNQDRYGKNNQAGKYDNHDWNMEQRNHNDEMNRGREYENQYRGGNYQREQQRYPSHYREVQPVIRTRGTGVGTAVVAGALFGLVAGAILSH